MRRSYCFIGLLSVALTGCQSWGGGYSPQSMTRVPAISTGSFQVPGNYYGNQSAAQASTSNPVGLQSGNTVAGGRPMFTAASASGTGNANVPGTAVSSAQFTTDINEQSLNVPVITASGSAPVNNW
jgi:hypothetical protein